MALVLWGGYIGGAESFTADLAGAMRRQDADPSVLFVLNGYPLSQRLDRDGIQHASLSLPRGRSVLLNPRRFAHATKSVGCDAAILIECGYLPAALRLGGYDAPIIAVEHGAILEFDRLPLFRRWARLLAWSAGTWACSSIVAVSGYIRDRLSQGIGSRRVVCIPNGVDLERFSPPNETTGLINSGVLSVACAARLVKGKGIDDLIRAIATLRRSQYHLRIAGDGPERESLKALVHSLDLDSEVELLGQVSDMPGFWRDADIAVVPTNTLSESFGMSAVEAMSCGKPVIASNRGALSQIVVDGQTGRIFEAGNICALASALADYARDAALRNRHGLQARRRCEEEFSVDHTALQYLGLCRKLVADSTRT